MTFKDGSKFTRKILEPCAGYFATGIACLNLGLECVGVEIDQKHYENAKRRMKVWTPNPVNPKTVARIKEAKAQQTLS